MVQEDALGYGCILTFGLILPERPMTVLFKYAGFMVVFDCGATRLIFCVYGPSVHRVI